MEQDVLRTHAALQPRAPRRRTCIDITRTSAHPRLTSLRPAKMGNAASSCPAWASSSTQAGGADSLLKGMGRAHLAPEDAAACAGRRPAGAPKTLAVSIVELPTAIPAGLDLGQTMVVLIDVQRMTTTLTTALAEGAGGIRVFRTVEEVGLPIARHDSGTAGSLIGRQPSTGSRGTPRRCAAEHRCLYAAAARADRCRRQRRATTRRAGCSAENGTASRSLASTVTTHRGHTSSPALSRCAHTDTPSSPHPTPHTHTPAPRAIKLLHSCSPPALLSAAPVLNQWRVCKLDGSCHFQSACTHASLTWRPAVQCAGQDTAVHHNQRQPGRSARQVCRDFSLRLLCQHDRRPRGGAHPVFAPHPMLRSGVLLRRQRLRRLLIAAGCCWLLLLLLSACLACTRMCCSDPVLPALVGACRLYLAQHERTMGSNEPCVCAGAPNPVADGPAALLRHCRQALRRGRNLRRGDG